MVVIDKFWTIIISDFCLLKPRSSKYSIDWDKDFFVQIKTDYTYYFSPYPKQQWLFIKRWIKFHWFTRLKLPHDFWIKFGNSDYSGLEISNDRQHEKEEKITDILVITVCWWKWNVWPICIAGGNNDFQDREFNAQ